MDPHPNRLTDYDASDVTVNWVIFVIGLIPVAVATLRGVAWGVQPSIGLVLMIFAAPGLCRHYAARLRARSKEETRE